MCRKEGLLKKKEDDQRSMMADLIDHFHVVVESQVKDVQLKVGVSE